MTKVWLEAGFRTERVDMAGKKLVFRRIRDSSFRENSMPAYSASAGSSGDNFSVEKEPRRHPLFGRLKGTFIIDPSWNLTQPAMPEWADLIDEKYGPEPKK
ncbi:MAG TPA: hypothetical protein VHT03_09600 [Rhizomicrobium sp.]|jgi:hypothetical protein|nr:hypothetical protein [Rhizomicrobium sp.]